MTQWKCGSCGFTMTFPTKPPIACRGKDNTCKAKNWQEVSVKAQQVPVHAMQIKAATANEEDDAYRYMVATDVTVKKSASRQEKSGCFSKYFLTNLGQSTYDGDDIRELARQYHKIKERLPIVEGWGQFVTEKALPKVPLKCETLKEVWQPHAQKVMEHVKVLIREGSIYTGASNAGGADIVCISVAFLAESPLRAIQFALGHETGHAIDLGALRPDEKLQKALYPGFDANSKHDREYIADCIATLLLYAAGIYEEYILAGADRLFGKEQGGTEHPSGGRRVENVKRTLAYLAT